MSDWDVISHEREETEDDKSASLVAVAATHASGAADTAKKAAEEARQSAEETKAAIDDLQKALEQAHKYGDELRGKTEKLDGIAALLSDLIEQMQSHHKESMGAFTKALSELAKGHKTMADAMGKKRKVIRGSDGRVEGLE